MSETPALHRPRQVTMAAWMIIVGSLFVVVSAFEQVSSLRRVEVRDALAEVLAQPGMEGFDLEGTVQLLRTVAMVTAACAAATAIMGYFLLQRHRGARVVVTLLAVPLLVGGMLLGIGMLPGAALPFLVAVPVVLLWIDPSRDWFNGVAPRPRQPEPAAARPDPFGPPSPPPDEPDTPRPASEPRAHQGFGSAPTTPSQRPAQQPGSPPTAFPPYAPPHQQAPAAPAYPPPPPGAQPYAAPPPQPVPYAPVRPAPASWTRPAAVLAACVVTWICASFAAVVMGGMLAAVLLIPEGDLIDALNRQDPQFSRELGASSLQSVVTVTSVLVIVWSLAAIVLAVLVFRRTGWARYALLGSTGGAGGLLLVVSLQSPFMVVPLLACAVTFSLLLRADVRGWFARSQSNP